MYIIIRGKSKFGKTRSEQEQNLIKEGWGKTLTEEQLDKCKFLEKKIKETLGTDKTFLRQNIIDKVK